MSGEERFRGANTLDAGRLSPYWGEHAARYIFALPYVKNKTVLDIACGTGYGLVLLKEKATRVTGVDVHPQAAKDAKAECGKLASVLLGDGLNLPFVGESFDVVTSFETLEHLHDRARFLAELKRVLKLDGLLVLSTPNAKYTNPINGKPRNPFHIFEYTPEGLREEIERQFVIVEFLGQSLNARCGIPPFVEAQQKLPHDITTQIRLLGWKIMNKMPPTLRERLSEAMWKKPFYPSEADYIFDLATVSAAPVLVAVCRKTD